MERIASQIGEAEEVTQYVTESDWVPDFWNFLLGLDRNDLIAELVQNDLDQAATQTVISFEQNRMFSEGNGQPVDADGWRRLRKIRGAGERVPAKRGKIGVKNHGLKTAFTIGDEIRVLSDGLGITQTLYAKGPDKAPYPGASPEPRPDPSAPETGCRVEIAYRTRKLEPREGEAFVFDEIGAAYVENLFRSACASTPEQFAGIVSPEVAPRYEIVLHHWQLGEARFTFSCGRTQKVTKELQVFRRQCMVSGTAEDLPPTMREEAVRHVQVLKGRLKDRLPDFFRRKRKYFVEVSWPVDGRGRPQRGVGRFRYPIGYPVGSLEARTGHGATFNAPIVSDTERHGPSPNDATNQELRMACEKLLVDILVRRLVRKWGPNAMTVLVPDERTESEGEAVRPLLASLANRGGVPTVTKEEAIRLLHRGRKSKGKSALRASPRRARGQDSRRYGFVIPEATWSKGAINENLVLLCPPDERQLHPKVDPQIVRLLTDGQTSGWQETFVTFDENDAIATFGGQGNDFFKASPDIRTRLADTSLARVYLDVIFGAIIEGNLSSEEELDVQAALLLPDSSGQIAEFRKLHVSASLPLDIPGLRLPPILHPKIAGHRLFGRKRWKCPKYTMTVFLEDDTLETADETTRLRFWKWLRKQPGKVVSRKLSKLADLAIWPDNHGMLHRLSELCEPRSRAAATRLANVIARPNDHVHRSGFVKLGGGRKTAVRRVPTVEELVAWLNSKTSNFVIDSKADKETKAALDRFEADLIVLLKDQGISRQFQYISISLLTLAQDGSMRWRSGLVVPSKNVSQLALPGRFVLASGRRAAPLDRLSAPIGEPTVDMLFSAFEEDAGNQNALHARLRSFLALSDEDDAERQRLSQISIIPLHGKLYPPSALAFAGPRGDYWGDWKARLSAKGLSQDNQKRYIDVGVVPSTPTADGSRMFFEWLSDQEPRSLERHIPCALRHVLHRHGPGAWSEVYTDVPFISVRSRDGIRLVSLQHARHRRVFLPDVRELTESILEADAGVSFVIDRVREVTEPVSEVFRKLGIRGLREAIGEPVQVSGTAKVQEAGDELRERLEALRSPRFRRTFLKRLDELGVVSDLVRRDWYDRVSRIKEIYFTASVNAKFRLGRHAYDMSVDAGFDPDTGIFWVKERQQGARGSFYEAVAAQLIFKPVARPVDHLALERTLELEIQDPSFGRPVTPEATDGEDGADDDAEVWDDEQEIGQATEGHAPFVPDPTRNVPTPQPVPERSSGGQRQHKHSGGTVVHTKGKREQDFQPELEKEQVDNLKARHYASHCQMCLCERAPSDLAPRNSYVQWEEVRRSVIHGHHVDPKSGGGARHVGNIILLCKFHHDNIGRRLTRDAITSALRSDSRSKRLEFDVAEGETIALDGYEIEITILDTGEIVTLFFTKEHVNYWLSRISSK